MKAKQNIWVALGNECMISEGEVKKAIDRAEKLNKRRYPQLRRMPNVTINVTIEGKSQTICFLMVNGTRRKANVERIYTKVLCDIFPEIG